MWDIITAGLVGAAVGGWAAYAGVFGTGLAAGQDLAEGLGCAITSADWAQGAINGAVSGAANGFASAFGKALATRETAGEFVTTKRRHKIPEGASRR